VEAGKVLEYSLPLPVDPDNDNVTTTVTLQDSIPFTSFEEGKFNFAPLSSQVRPTPYVIKITLTDDSPSQLKTNYNLQVTVIATEVPEIT